MKLLLMCRGLPACAALALVRVFRTIGLAGLCLSGFSVGAALANPTNAAPVPLASCSPALEQAAAAFAQGHLNEAARSFESVADDLKAPAFARGVALLGMARACRENTDSAGALKALNRLATEADLPGALRDLALRLIQEIEPQAQAKAARHPDSYRASLPATGKPGLVLHVATTAPGLGDGSKARSYPSLSQARDAIRQWKKSHDGTLPSGGVRVLIHGGTYPVSDTFVLEQQDSGTSEAPIIYQAKHGTLPVFFGGAPIRDWKPLSDPKLLEQLDPAARGRVFEAELASLGLKDLGDPTELRRAPELFCDGVPQTLARWPNDGFVRIAETLGSDLITNGPALDGCKDGKFRFAEERPTRWLSEPDVRLYGYWYWDWLEEFQKVSAIDPAARSFTLAAPYSRYGYRKGQRYRAVNVFRELDQPGEWYLDRRTARLYWLPPDGIQPQRAQVTLSCFAPPFVVLENVAHVILLGLTFEAGRGDAIHISGGDNCLVAGCTIRQFGGDGVVVDGGSHHGVFGCAITCMGCGGMRVKGGDRNSLTAGHHFVENCFVSDISRLQRTYTPAVLLEGCGNRVAHNRFEWMPSSALRVEGNDQLVELNQIRHVVRESDDQGGLDCWGNPLYRGLVIRWNQWSDITGGTHCGAAGVRLDDMISGVAIYGNLFERCGAALFGGMQIHGGKDNLIDGNVFLDCHAGISFSWWGEKRWRQGIKDFLAQAGTPPYSQHYPDLARLQEDADRNFISRNVFARCGAPFLRDAGKERMVLNLSTPRSFELNQFGQARRARQNPELRRLLLDPIPVGEIGPYPHPWRATAPAEPRGRGL
jgi:hypothetical protein